MKIGFFGDGTWSHNAILHLVNDPTFEIAFICVRFKNPDTKLIEFAREKRIQLYIEKEVNSKEFLDKLKKMKLDLIVSMSFDQIFKKEIIGLPKFGSINCHAGKLPYYRGRNVLNWVLINDEKEFGITVHYIDEGIDSGDIIVQKVFPITEDDNYATLLTKAYTECASLLYDGIKKIQHNKVRRISQSEIDNYGSYFTQRKNGDEVIDWNKTSREIFNFIRALTIPGPCASTYHGEIEIKILEAQFMTSANAYKGINGVIINVQHGAFFVKTSDSFIRVVKWNEEFVPRIGIRLK